MTATNLSEQIAATLTFLSKEIYEANKAKGFWPELHTRGDLTCLQEIQVYNSDTKETYLGLGLLPVRNIGEALMLCVTELSEALEIFRKHELSAESNVLPGHCHFTEELADTIIRLLDIAGGLELSIGETLMKKLEYNKTRPHKHGKKF